MYSLLTYRDTAANPYEHSLPPAFPWNRLPGQDVPRYRLGDDGYWYDPAAVASDTALLSCVGDLMCEPRMTNAHRYGDAYFFHPLFRHVREILRSSDFAIANLETTLSDSTPYAGDYHCIAGKYHCNAPACYLDAVRYAGFDALVTANNHNCDSGVHGLWDTLRAVDDHRFMRTGSFLPTDTERVLLVNIGGFRVAILSYGNRYNGLDERHWTSEGIDRYLNWFSRERCLEDVAYARAHGAEFVLCYQHWGCDYDEEPNEQQHRILNELKDCGVDYIVGSHTHCLQRFDTVTASDGRRIPLTFSMGNFVTNEGKELCKHTGILQLMLTREAGGITVREQLIPCYVFDEFGTGRFCVVPTDGRLNGGFTHERMADINAYIRARVGDTVPFAPERAVSLSTLCETMDLPLTVADTPVTKLCTQSATVCRGAVYFALETPTAIDRRRLIAAGVAAVVTPEPIPRVPCLITEDVAAAYRAAHALIRPFGDTACPILVAGGADKTLTRALIARALRTVGGVLTPPDAEHSDLSPWQDVHPFHRYIVCELQANHPLGVREAAALYHPEVLVLTAAPCDVSALADSLPSGGTLLYNETDTALSAAIAALTRTDITVIPYGGEALPCPALPFDRLSPCTAAAAMLAAREGAQEAAVRAAIASYVPSGSTQAIIEASGVTAVLCTNCHTENEACSALRAAPSNGCRIAVLAAPAYAPYAANFRESLAAWRPDAVFTLGDLGLEGATVCENLDALETALLSTLKRGDTVCFIGGREACLCETARRLLGITDGFLTGAS